MFASLKQYFFNPVCFHCGSLFVEKHLFCEYCFETTLAPRLELKEQVLELEGHTIKHYYLMEWIPGESDLISSLVYQLKKDRSIYALSYYARLMTKQLQMQNTDFSQCNCILPLAGSSVRSVHSQVLAAQLGLDLGLPARSVFRKTAVGIQQKKWSRKQRAELEIITCSNQVRELITVTGNNKLSPIYVDDILTTGNTLKASINALSVAQGGCVMTLFFRSPASVHLQED